MTAGKQHWVGWVFKEGREEKGKAEKQTVKTRRGTTWNLRLEFISSEAGLVTFVCVCACQVMVKLAKFPIHKSISHIFTKLFSCVPMLIYDLRLSGQLQLPPLEACVSLKGRLNGHLTLLRGKKKTSPL